jgi:hypothetical protein
MLQPLLIPMCLSLALGPGDGAAPKAVEPPKPAAELTDKYAVEHVKLTILSERQAIWPGGSVDIALRFSIIPKWHLYWRGQNDTGFAPDVTWTLPKGYAAGETIWPVPKRHISPGDLLDHVYYNELLLITTITAPADAKPGASVKFSADAKWLVCEDACVPESGKVSIELPVVAGEGLSSPSKDVELFTLARRAAPKSLIAPKSDKPEAPGWNKPVMPSEPGVFSTRWEGTTLVISAADKNDRLAFMPDADGATALNLLKSGSSKTGTLRLDFEPGDSKKPVMGMVVVVDHDEARKNAYLIKLALPNASEPTKPTPGTTAPIKK